jgi:hypothetical protein
MGEEMKRGRTVASFFNLEMAPDDEMLSGFSIFKGVLIKQVRPREDFLEAFLHGRRRC